MQKQEKTQKQDLCTNLEIRLPFFNVKPEDVKRLVNKGVVEQRITTAICMPYLEKREQYRTHIPKCKTCKPIYEKFLEKMSQELDMFEQEIDKDYLKIYDRL